MAPPPLPSKKRKHHHSHSHNHNHRQQQQQQQTGAAGGPETKRRRKAASKRSSGNKVAVAVAVADAGSLAWRTLDEETFGGLQVIEGVEVVKEGDGRVSFVVAEEEEEEDSFEGFGDDDDDDANGAVDAADVNEEREIHDDTRKNKKKKKKKEGVDRSGDDVGQKREQGGKRAVNPTRDDGQLADTQANTNTNDKKKKEKTKIKTKTKMAEDSDGEAHMNPFSALMDIDDDDDDDDDKGLHLENWIALDLSPKIVSAIGKLGFDRPTPIQQQSIPLILAGADVIGKAQTGSGKTLAFGIPIVERWLALERGRERHVSCAASVDGDSSDSDSDSDDSDDGEKKTTTTPIIHHNQPTTQRKSPTAVILSPTRELAKQIGDHILALCHGLASSSSSSAPYVCVVTGGLSIQKQQRQLAKADIVVATPGRLWEVLDGDAALQDAFASISFLVVDEADRLFKAGQFKEAELIIGALDRRDPEADSEDDDDDDREEEEEEGGGEKYGRAGGVGGSGKLPPRQTLVFSATFDKDLQTKLAGKRRSAARATNEDKMAYLMKCLKFRTRPKFIDVNPVSQMAQGLREGLIECGAMEKDLYLYAVLLLNPGRRTLVFTNSISAVRRITPFLQNLDVPAQPLHSQMAQKARLRSLERFSGVRGSNSNSNNNNNNSNRSSSVVLVATDVAARGLDIKDVDLVLHYHVPRTADAYVHRSGRTARGDRAGVSVMLCAPDEVLSTRRLAGKVHAAASNRQQPQQQQHQNQKPHHHVLETLHLDRKVVARLKPRADLSKKLADAVLAKEKAHSQDTWLRGAAAELGVEYDSEDFDDTNNNNNGNNNGKNGGNAGGRKRRNLAAAAVTRAEMGALRAQLREDLGRRVNLGVSERYIAGGRVDMAKLLRDKERATSVGGLFLGGDDSLGLGFGVKL